MERRPAPGKRSTYGQACGHCFKAKCRCIPSPTGGRCERCLRLSKDCQPSDSARRRNAQQTAATDPRIVQLEGKVDSLLSAMQSVMNLQSTTAILQPFVSPEAVSYSTAGSGVASNSSTCASSNTGASTPASRTPLTGPSHSDRTSLFQHASPHAYLSPAEAETSLAFFRSAMLPSFPFIDLPPTLTTRQLRQDRPIFFQAIVTVTTLSIQQRLPQTERLKQAVFTSALTSAQSSIDLLLGVLTYIAWSTDAFLGRADVLSRLMVLSMSLVYDLRLFKPLSSDVQTIVAYTQGFFESNRNIDVDTVHGFMERQRALLACFVLSSHISSHFGRIDALRWTPQLDDALQIIAANKSSRADKIFTVQVRLQLLVQKASQLREQHEADCSRAAAASLLYLNTLQAELQGLQTSLNLGFNQQEMHHTRPLHLSILAAHAHYTNLYLNQASLSIISTSPPATNTSGQQASFSKDPLPGFDRLSSFWQSVEAIKSFLDTLRTIPPANCIGLPSHFWAHTIWCTAVLKHLSTHPDPALDYRAVRGRLDLLSALDWMAGRFEMVSDEVGVGVSGVGDDNLFKLLSRLMGRARTWAEARWDVLPGAQGQGEQGCQSSGGEGCGTGVDITSRKDVEDMTWMYSMDLESEMWFENALGWSPAAE